MPESIAPPENSKDLRIVLKHDDCSCFQPLLQTGFFIRTTSGTTVLEFLLRDLKLSRKVVDDDIQTVFLNGRAVDEMAEAWVQDGDILALSAALPGLVGATFRREGFFASMRSSVTLQGQSGVKAGGKPALVRVKLFNLLVRTLGPLILAQGVLVYEEELLDMLFEAAFLHSCTGILINGERVPPIPEDLAGRFSQGELIRLRLEA